MRKKTRTRKQKTLRRALVFLLLLVAALELHLLCFTPTQTIRAAEYRLGLEPTEIVLSNDDLYLSESEEVLLLTTHRPGRWRGMAFATPPLAVMDKTKGQPALGGGYWLRDFGETRETFHLLGEVFLEDAVAVRAYCDIDPSYGYRSVELTAEIFTAENGRRYFWSVTERAAEAIDTLPFALDVLDRDGNVLYTCDTSGSWTGDG